MDTYKEIGDGHHSRPICGPGSTMGRHRGGKGDRCDMRRFPIAAAHHFVERNSAYRTCPRFSPVPVFPLRPARLNWCPMVSVPDFPHHWYRQDSNGLWSSKHGQLPVGAEVIGGSDHPTGGVGQIIYPDIDAVATGYEKWCANMCAPNQNGKAPEFPGPYNLTSLVMADNCYSYARDVVNFGPPGSYKDPGGDLPKNFECIDVIIGAKADGLRMDLDAPNSRY